jgi:hypothetical protein
MFVLVLDARSNRPKSTHLSLISAAVADAVHCRCLLPLITGAAAGY